jgi:hypothetical protein
LTNFANFLGKFCQIIYTKKLEKQTLLPMERIFVSLKIMRQKKKKMEGKPSGNNSSKLSELS